MLGRGRCLGREAAERATKSLSFDRFFFFLNPPVAYEMQPVPYNF